MKIKIAKAIGIIVIAAMLCIIVYTLFIANERDFSLAAKAAVIIVTYTLAMVGVRRSFMSVKDYMVYKDKYKDIINDAFETDRKSLRQLIKAIHMFNINKHSKALKILGRLENSCVSVSDRSAVLTFKALVLKDMGMQNSAAEVYEELLKSDITNSRVWSNLGLIYYEQGKTDKARRAYENAVTYDPDNAYAYCNLAGFYVGSNEPQKALEYALKSLEINGKLYQSMSAAAIAYKLLGDREMSEKYFKMYGANGGNTKNLRQTLENTPAL